MRHLTIVTTGGTIDKIYFDDLSTYQIGEPEIGRILTSFGVGFSFNVIALMRKDSLHLTDEDRELIRRTVADCRGAFVVYLLVWFVIVLGVGLASALFFGVLGLRALAQVASFPIMLFVSTLFYASLIFTFNDSFGQQA